MGSCLSKRKPPFLIGRSCWRHRWPSPAASRSAQGRSPSPSPSQKPSQKPPQKPSQEPSQKPSQKPLQKSSPSPSQKPSQSSSQKPSQELAQAEEKGRVTKRGRAWTRDEETGKWSKCAAHASKEEMEGLQAHSRKPPPPSPSPWAAAFRAVQERSPSPPSESEGFLATTRTSHATATTPGRSPSPTAGPEGFLDGDFAYDSDECEAVEIELMRSTATESSGHFPAISNEVARRRALVLMEKETDEDRRVQDQFRAAARIRNGADDKYLRKNSELEMDGADEAIPVLSSSPEDVVSVPVASA